MASIFGSTAAQPPADKKALGLDTSKIPTNEQGVVLRYFAGIALFSCTWLGPAYNQKTKAVSSGGSKGGGGGTQHKYYADCAGLLCLGPVDELLAVYMSQDEVWSGSIVRDGTNIDSASITIENKGVMTIYWGTETQPIDSLLGAQNHPAYRGQCYVVFQQLYFGEDTTTAPDVQFLVRRTPAGLGLSTEGNYDSDVHPPHAMLELLSNQRYGLGWDAAAQLDLDAWDAAAAQLRTEQVAISPTVDREQDARTLLTQFCEYFDGYLVADPAHGGRLALHLARPFAGDSTTLPLLGEYGLLEPPEPSSQSWRDTANEIFVKFTDRDNSFTTNSETFIELANRRVANGEPLPLSLDRPWFTRDYQAAKAAAYAARLRGVPWLTAKIQIRKEAAAGLLPGAFVRLTYADYDTTIIVRILSRKVAEDRSQAVEFEVRADGYYNEIVPYVADRPPVGDVPGISPQVALFSQVFELPFGLARSSTDRTLPQLAGLVARAGGLEVKWLLYGSDDAGVNYDEVAHSRRFALSGTLAADYPATETLDDGSGGLLIDLVGPDGPADLAATNERGRLRLRLLVFAGSEIMAYREAVLISTTRVRLLGLRRGCYDTEAAAHLAGDPVAIIARRDLRDFTDPVFAAGDAIDFKVATATAAATLDLALPPAQSLTLLNRTARPLPPLNVRVNGQTGPASTYSTGSDILIEWDIANWRRHAFWDSWDSAFADDQLKHKIRVRAAAGSPVLRRIKVAPGLAVATYANADLLADFGAEPASFYLEIFARRRGQLSLHGIPQTLTKV